MQELDKYNSIISSFQALENDKQPYWYVVEWESIEEPTVLKNFTGGKRVTGLDKFKKAVETLQHITNCAKIHVNVYSGQTGKKRLWGEVLKVRDYSNPGYIPPPPLISARKAEPIQQQQAQAAPQPQPFNGLELLGAILGQPGLSGAVNYPRVCSRSDEG
jgi:hypothetical protein